MNVELRIYLKTLVKFLIQVVSERNRRRKRIRFANTITAADVRTALDLLDLPKKSRHTRKEILDNYNIISLKSPHNNNSVKSQEIISDSE